MNILCIKYIYIYTINGDTQEVIESILLKKKKNVKRNNPQVIGYSQIIPLSNHSKNLCGRCSKKVIASN